MKLKILIFSICIFLFASCAEDKSNTDILAVPEVQQQEETVVPQEMTTGDITEQEKQIIESLFEE